MIKRLFDVVASGLGLALTAPLMAVAAVGIRLSSAGPVVYRARRAGMGGRPFTMYKLRTMRVNHGLWRSRITTAHDPRVFPFGRLLRATKIDELPQLLNVLRGDMSIVGPRPEDPDLVARCYTPLQRETLRVRPGLAGPGSLYHDTHVGGVSGAGDAENEYATRVLPIKLALDLVYVRHASWWYDVRLVARTLSVIVGSVLGRRRFPDPPELPRARELMALPPVGEEPTTAWTTALETAGVRAP